MMQTQNSLFGVEAIKQKKSTKKAAQSQKEQRSPYYFQVMQLGNSCHYKQLQVNGSLIIGSGPEGWRAYAVLAAEKRIEEINRALKRQHE